VSRALFLDRDGVINEDRAYVHRIEDFRFTDGIFDTAAVARELGFALVVVTNQAGIGRGLYDWSDFHRLTAWMSGEFARRGTPLTQVYACPYHPEARAPYRVADHPDRKPNPGMLVRAIREHGFDPTQCLLIGDKEIDITAGLRAGLGGTALLSAVVEAQDTRANAVLRSHRDACDWLRRSAGR
jgi:D-glycero-D-manno-heptose 1,7-bisphosphate phosphatase